MPEVSNGSAAPQTEQKKAQQVPPPPKEAAKKEEVIMPEGIDYEKLAAVMLAQQERQKSSSPTIDTAALVKAIKGDDKGERHHGHGFTHNQVKEIKKAQQNSTVEMMPSNKVSRHNIPVTEKGFMHYTTEKVLFDQEKGNRLSKPKYHISTVEDFTRMSQTSKGPGQVANPENAFQGLSLVILHDARPEVAQSKKKKMTDDEMLSDHMSEEAIRHIYFEVFGEEALPSDSKKVMVDLIKEKRQAQGA